MSKPSPSPASAQGRPSGLTGLSGLTLGGAPKRLTDGLSQALAHTTDEATAEQSGLRTFELEADELMSRQRTQRAQAAVRAALLIVVLLIVWSAWAEVDEVTRGDARVIPSRQLQLVQSFDGGIVSEILVTEGQMVEAGQLLLRIDETRATSGVRESAAQGFALRARTARLSALAEGKPFLPPKADGAEEKQILEEERRLYESRQSELANEVSIVRQQILQRQQELSEAQSRRSAAQRALDLGQQELAQTRPLLASGAVSQVEVLRLERDVSRSRGEMEQATAMIARAQAAIGESQRRVQEAELGFRNETRRELAETVGKLNALTQGAVALTDRVQKAQVKSPVRGRVQRLLANTVGGVVQPGKDIVEIVPADDTLVLEARVAPKDIAFIRPKQAATVKFTAYDYAIYGSLEATVENISPDTVIDERGNAFYQVRVRTKVPDLGEKLPIIPGMTAEVDVLTGRKSVLSYLLKPILRVQSKALRER
jgi:membrane fusion protein, adhesin transport system